MIPQDAPVQTRDGTSQPLGSLLTGPTLLVFVRHWGCMECSLLWADLKPRLPELERLGVAVVAIGCGSPAGIDAYVDKYRLEVRVVTDPTLAVQAGAGLQHSVWASAGPRALWSMLLGWGQGHGNRMGDGDFRQQSGAVLLDADGTEVWRHTSSHLGDHVRGTDLVDAALALTAGESPWRP